MPGLEDLVHDYVVHVLDSCMTKDETGPKKCREKNAICDLAGNTGC